MFNGKRCGWQFSGIGLKWNIFGSQTFWPGWFSVAWFLWRPAKRQLFSTEQSRAARVSLQTLRYRRRCIWTEWTANLLSWEGNRGSWKSRESSKGDKPVAELVKMLWVYSIQSQGNSCQTNPKKWPLLGSRLQCSSTCCLYRPNCCIAQWASTPWPLYRRPLLWD